MKTTVCPKDKDENSIIKECYKIHDTKKDNNPTMDGLQPWDLHQSESLGVVRIPM
jgi:hypothetical protein